MLSILMQLASSDNPSGLAESLLKKNPESPTNTQSSSALIALLYFSESWRSEAYQEVTRYMPILMRGLSLSEKISYQWLRTFLKDQQPALFTTKPRFVGYDKFEVWLRGNGKKLTFPSTSTNTKKSKTPSSPMAILENACKSFMFREDLYKELRILAPFGCYSHGKTVHVKAENSFFNLDSNPQARPLIAHVLESYRTWMLENNFFDSALSSLTLVSSSVASSKRYSHVVLDGTTEVSPNIFHYLTTITEDLTICMPRSIKIAEDMLYVLQSPTLLESWLTTQHQRTYDASNNEEKDFSRKLIATLLQINDSHLENFVKKSIQHNRYLVFLSAITHADFEQPQEVQVIKKLLGYFGDYVNDNPFPSKNNNDFYDMMSSFFNALADSQNEAYEKECTAEISELIFSLAILFAKKLLEVKSHHYALYRKIFRVFEYSTIKNRRELTEVADIFNKIHAEIFMQTTVAIHLSETDIIKTWDIMRDTYSSLIIISAQTKNFYESFRVSIIAHKALKQHCAKFCVNKRPEHTDWHAVNYVNVWVNFIAEINLADEQNDTLVPDFFEVIFRFFSENPLNHQWPLDCKTQILFNFTQFLISSTNYYLNRDELKSSFPWEGMRKLFEINSFSYASHGATICAIHLFIDRVSTSSDIESTLIDELSTILEIGEKLRQATQVKSRITENEYALFGKLRERASDAPTVRANKR